MGNFGNGNGYNGYSMSNNAVSAYDNGEMPKSKWNKQAVIEAVAKNEDVSSSEVTLLKAWSEYLVTSSWHHTSKNYNRTNFYKVEYKKENIKIDSEALAKKENLYLEEIKANLLSTEQILLLLPTLAPKKDAIIKLLDNGRLNLSFPKSYEVLCLYIPVFTTAQYINNYCETIINEKIPSWTIYYVEQKERLEKIIKG